MSDTSTPAPPSGAPGAGGTPAPGEPVTRDWTHPAQGPAPTKTLGDRPSRPAVVVLALGANLGEADQTMDAAVAALTVMPGFTDVQASPRALTKPVGGPPGQPDYRNQVVTARTTRSPWEVLGIAHLLEQEHHRRRTVRWGARTLDVDIVAYGDLTSDHPDLTLPHPRAAERAFVLLPWLWLDPDAALAGVPVAELAERAEGADTVRRMPPERVHLDGGPARPKPSLPDGGRLSPGASSASRGASRQEETAPGERIDSTWRDRT